MNAIQNNSIDMLKVCEQIDVLLFQALECPSESGVFSLIEIAMEKNNQMKKWLSSEPANKDDAPSHVTFPQRLKQAMEAAGLTQKELAERAGVSQGLISKLVLGKAAESRKIIVIAHALGVTADWLHYGTGEMYAANFSADSREV
ncbi:helix-turn-helix transcriptional regulator [Morganella morganii]|uniref:helix-turn-helix domain-containing protein n=1 Tax=Morganella morganii TaxID=582 RepID=UPI000D1E5673|nr:helix-turn-helix transcriptional regulator [Morganella morganii]QXO42253.1 helix-turn-helix transcriptional regulator [Morganella morganii]QXO45885.1 helix-turn-helix transcriptional regulator [Morganella morganii]QXO49556.1 helix-turn-helix transcriptional regulator [Morganella morganii]QXO53416.1 helix-turn-helix transcriptional regulator [Morganella morganii]QXO80055.1 helix-turn-helix transcriptional regulator [Morganella morganii]